ncbi:hypothetical protein [Nocardioides ferulae]|uniref:hypothetical protein n=1 Tax=Nocardioides ferulae TaxID=2340821 RepID=UPI000EB3A269|nr:hypothetical protein [Nocardioides ferulae]
MTDGAVHREPDHAEVAAFWNLARFHAKLNSLPGYFGPTALEAVPPPVWSLGESAAEADELVDRLLDAASVELPVPLIEFGGEELPEVGALGIVADGGGHPRALVSTTAVEVQGDAVVEHLRVLWAPERGA